MSQFVNPEEGQKYEENLTPAYVFDLDQLEQRVSAVKAGITREGTKLYFDVKANPFLVEALKGQVDGYKVCSPGEFHVCESNEVTMEDVVVSGVYKAPLDVMRTIGEFDGRTLFTVESLNQLQILDLCAGRYKQRVRVLLSLSAGDQFGMKESQVEYCAEHREEYTNLEVVGVQYYSGTQKKDLGRVEEELHMLEAFCRKLEKEYAFETKILEYGPGLGVPYFEEDEEEDLEQVLESLDKLLNALDFSGTLVLEMGRFLTAFCGSYYTSVSDVKNNAGQNYCIVDGGIHHLNYYGSNGGERTPHCTHMPQKMNLKTEESMWKVCGCLCTPEDVLAAKLPLRAPEIGDLLIFERAGAYSVTNGITLHMSQDLPKVYLYSQETGMELIRKREGTCKLNMRPEEDDEE